MQHQQAKAELTRQIARARQALAIERALPLALAPVIFALVWASLALLGGLAVLPALAASLAAIAALGAILFLTHRAWRAYRRPSEAEARARLELDAKLDRGVLAGLEDAPSRLDPGGLALWKREQSRAMAKAAAARAEPARISLSKPELWGLSGAVALGLVSVVIAGGRAPDRLSQAFAPDPGPLLGDGRMQIEAWASPAAYTGAAPVALSERIGERIETPPSTEATVRVTGPVGPPKLVFRGEGGQREARFTRGADGAWEARLAIPGEGVLEVVRFKTKARWRIAPRPDAAPQAFFVEAPQVEGDKIKFSWRGSDDYGIEAVGLEMTMVAPGPGLADNPARTSPLNFAGQGARDASGQENAEMLRHAYAGFAVDARVVVRDALGQIGRSEAVRLTMPEKVFLQPLAQAAIEIRRTVHFERRPYQAPPKNLAEPTQIRVFDPLMGQRSLALMNEDPAQRLERAPLGIKRAVAMLEALTVAPEDGFFSDTAVFAGFALSRAMLSSGREIEESEAAADVLWDLANRIEHGDSGDTRQALDAARQALSQAIARGASPQELERLADAVEEAVNNHIGALIEEAVRNRRPEQEADAEDNSRELDLNDLAQMAQEAERLAREGRREEAQAMLDELGQLMENLEIRLSSAPPREGDQQRNQAQVPRQSLDEAIQNQRRLRDETQSSDGDGQGQSGGEALAERQRQLRQSLQQGPRPPGGAGERMDEAGRAMQEAENALKRGDFDAARRAQDEALAGLNAANQRLRQQQNADQDGPRGDTTDPLGRTSAISGDSGDVRVPEKSERQRSRDLEEELRRRAQDPRRPQQERDYLRRLLDRFEGT